MDYKKELVLYAHMLEDKGYVNALEGNISILDRENRRLYITPSGTRKKFLTEEMIAVLDYDTEEQIEGTCKASSEYRLHKACYEARPDTNGCVHTHCTYLTAFALRNEPVRIKCNTAFAMVAKGEIKCIPYGEPGTPAIADGIGDAIADRNICLLGNHGVVSVGKDVASAFRVMEGMEETVKTYIVARSLGGEPNPLPDEVLDKLEHKANWIGK